MSGQGLVLPDTQAPVARRFERWYRVRFDEAGADGTLRASAIVRYLQDLAWRHSEAAGFDRAWYRTRGLFWLVRALELRVHAAATYRGDVLVGTDVVGWRRVLARRWSEVRGADGSLVAAATIDWVLLNDAGRPTRVPAEVEVFAPSAASFAPTHVDLPPTPLDARRATWVVRTADIDPMGHMNNATYLDLLDEALVSAGGRPPIGPGDEVQLEYLRPALPGTTVGIASWPESTALAFRLTGGDREELLLASVRRRPGPPGP